MEQQFKPWKIISIPNKRRKTEPFVKISKNKISFNSLVYKLWDMKYYNYIETYIDTEDKNKIAFKFIKQPTKNSLKITHHKNCKNYMIISSKILMQALIELTNIKINNKYKAEYIDEKIIIDLAKCI